MLSAVSLRFQHTAYGLVFSNNMLPNRSRCADHPDATKVVEEYSEITAGPTTSSPGRRLDVVTIFLFTASS
jgi:hypothetical protein